MGDARRSDPAEESASRRAGRDPDPAEARAALGFYATTGLTFGVVLVVSTALGYWLDTRLGTVPLLTLVGAAIGGIAGFWHLYRTLTAGVRDRDRIP